MSKFNKATASAIVGAILTAAHSIWPGMVTPEIMGAIQTVAVTVFVWLVPNK